MKKLILTAVLFVAATSTSIVSAQTYPGYAMKSFDNKIFFQRTTATTGVLKFENVDGIVVTKSLKNRSQTGEVITWRMSDGGYITLRPTPFNFSSYFCYELEYYNELGNFKWTGRICCENC
jgi:hypothetical protein